MGIFEEKWSCTPYLQSMVLYGVSEVIYCDAVDFSKVYKGAYLFVALCHIKGSIVQY